MDIQIVNVDPIRVVYIRHIGAYGSPTIADTWSRLCAWAGPKGILAKGTRCFGIGHDDPESTPPDKTRYDACLTAPAHVQGDGEVGVQTIAGGRYAKARHIGPYQKLVETYAALFGSALPANGHEPADAPPFEEYLNFPHDTAPENLITDIYIALKPAATAAAR